MVTTRRMSRRAAAEQQREGNGEEDQPQNIGPSQEQIKEEEEEGENKQEQVGAKSGRISRDVTVQQYHDILSEDINLLLELSNAIRNYCDGQSDARFEKLIIDYCKIVDSPSSDFNGLGERLCKLQKDYNLTDLVEGKMKDQVNLVGGFVNRMITAPEKDKDKAKRDILEAMRLVWNRINSVQDSAQQQPINIAPSVEESKEKEEEEGKQGSTRIAETDQEAKEVGDWFGVKLDGASQHARDKGSSELDQTISNVKDPPSLDEGFSIDDLDDYIEKLKKEEEENEAKKQRKM